MQPIPLECTSALLGLIPLFQKFRPSSFQLNNNFLRAVRSGPRKKWDLIRFLVRLRSGTIEIWTVPDVQFKFLHSRNRLPQMSSPSVSPDSALLSCLRQRGWVWVYGLRSHFRRHEESYESQRLMYMISQPQSFPEPSQLSQGASKGSGKTYRNAERSIEALDTVFDI